MSRHGKRLSVFDRLGPGNDEELAPTHSSSTSSSRHRHYSIEKHDRSHLNISSEKRLNDTSVNERARKHRNDDVDSMVAAKREKVPLSLRKDSKLVKPPLKGGGTSERREEQTDEQIRSKRKRERESLSDSETHHRETKRSKTESTLDRHKDTKADNSSHTLLKETLKKKSTEEADRSEIDWSLLASLPCPKPSSLKMNSLQKHKPGAIFTNTGVSLSLAGPVLSQKIIGCVSQHLQEHYLQDTIPELFDEPFGGYSLAGLGVSHLTSRMKSGKQLDIGMCRRALTAGVDFMMRKKYFQKYAPKENEYAGCFVPYYPASLKLYKS